MLAPTLAYLLAAVLLYRFLFRRVLRTFPSSPAQTAERVQLTGSERRNLVFLLAVVVLWATRIFTPLPALWLWQPPRRSCSPWGCCACRT